MRQQTCKSSCSAVWSRWANFWQGWVWDWLETHQIQRWLNSGSKFWFWKWSCFDKGWPSAWKGHSSQPCGQSRLKPGRTKAPQRQPSLSGVRRGLTFLTLRGMCIISPTITNYYYYRLVGVKYQQLKQANSFWSFCIFLPPAWISFQRSGLSTNSLPTTK